MARFLFPLSLVLIFNSSSHLVMSKGQSQVAPDNHHSSQILNFSGGSFQVNVPQRQNSSSSYSLSQLQPPPPFKTQSLTSSPPSSASQTRTIRSQKTTDINESGDDDGGHGRRNSNHHFVHTPADFMSLPQTQPSTHTRRMSHSRYRNGVAVPVPSFWSFVVSDSTREKAERRITRKRRSLPTTKPTNGGILQASNSNLSFVQDQQKLVLKLDRNYTPKDIAEYILSTGDERGIIQVVADMVQDGQLMASRDDVILFLETVQRELSKLKALNQLHR